MKTKVHYTYIHRKKSNGLPFYVGKGSGRRAWGAGNRSAAWAAAVKNDDFLVEIVGQFPTPQEAYEKEKEIIAALLLDGHVLVNVTGGGAGSAGASRGKALSVKTKMKLREAHLGKKQSPETVALRISKTTGKKRTAEQIERLRAAAIKRGKDPSYRKKLSEAQKGKRHSAETIAKLSALFKGKNTGPRGNAFKNACIEAQSKRAIAIVCLDTGQKFATQRKVVEWLVSIGKTRAVQSNISSACNGRVKSAYGYRWAFAEEFEKALATDITML